MDFFIKYKLFEFINKFEYIIDNYLPKYLYNRLIKVNSIFCRRNFKIISIICLIIFLFLFILVGILQHFYYNKNHLSCSNQNLLINKNNKILNFTSNALIITLVYHIHRIYLTTLQSSYSIENISKEYYSSCKSFIQNAKEFFINIFKCSDEDIIGTKTSFYASLCINIITTIAHLSYAYFDWGGLCIDAVGMITPLLLWTEKLVTVPMLCFITLVVGEKSVLSKSEVFFIFLVFFTILCAFSLQLIKDKSIYNLLSIITIALYFFCSFTIVILTQNDLYRARRDSLYLFNYFAENKDISESLKQKNSSFTIDTTESNKITSNTINDNNNFKFYSKNFSQRKKRENLLKKSILNINRISEEEYKENFYTYKNIEKGNNPGSSISESNKKVEYNKKSEAKPKYEFNTTNHIFLKSQHERILFLTSRKASLALCIGIKLLLFPIIYFLNRFFHTGTNLIFVLFVFCNAFVKIYFSALCTDVYLEVTHYSLSKLKSELAVQKSREAFLRFVFHELRGPLNTLEMGAHILQVDLLNEDIDLNRKLENLSNNESDNDYQSLLTQKSRKQNELDIVLLARQAMNSMNVTLDDALMYQKLEKGTLKLIYSEFKIIKFLFKIYFIYSNILSENHNITLNLIINFEDNSYGTIKENPLLEINENRINFKILKNIYMLYKASLKPNITFNDEYLNYLKDTLNKYTVSGDKFRLHQSFMSILQFISNSSCFNSIIDINITVKNDNTINFILPYTKNNYIINKDLEYYQTNSRNTPKEIEVEEISDLEDSLDKNDRYNSLSNSSSIFSLSKSFSTSPYSSPYQKKRENDSDSYWIQMNFSIIINETSLDESDASLAFVPFASLRHGDNKVNRSGLSMVLVREWIRLHGGNVSIEEFIPNDRSSNTNNNNPSLKLNIKLPLKVIKNFNGKRNNSFYEKIQEKFNDSVFEKEYYEIEKKSNIEIPIQNENFSLCKIKNDNKEISLIKPKDLEEINSISEDEQELEENILSPDSFDKKLHKLVKEIELDREEKIRQSNVGRNTELLSLDLDKINNAYEIQKNSECEPLNPSQDEISSEIPPLKDLKVLIVDDAVSNRKILTMLLVRLGISKNNIYHSYDGFDSVERVKESSPNSKVEMKTIESNSELLNDSTYPFHIIFMDYTMPRMCGYEAVKVLRKSLFFNNIIIGITGNTLTDDLKHFLDSGCDLVLQKPVKVTAIQAILKTIKIIGYESKLLSNQWMLTLRHYKYIKDMIDDKQIKQTYDELHGFKDSSIMNCSSLAFLNSPSSLSFSPTNNFPSNILIDSPCPNKEKTSLLYSIPCNNSSRNTESLLGFNSFGLRDEKEIEKRKKLENDLSLIMKINDKIIRNFKNENFLENLNCSFDQEIICLFVHTEDYWKNFKNQ